MTMTKMRLGLILVLTHHSKQVFDLPCSVIFLLTVALAPWRWAHIQPAIRQILLLGEKDDGPLDRPLTQGEKRETMLVSISPTRSWTS